MLNVTTYNSINFPIKKFCMDLFSIHKKDESKKKLFYQINTYTNCIQFKLFE